MADDQSQQTRVLLVNGQTIILQGDAGDNYINEINEDLLQQALDEALTSSTAVEEENNENFSFSVSDPEANSSNVLSNTNNVVAIFQGDQGETHEFTLSVEQAEALGITIKHEGSQDESATTRTISLGDENEHLIYPENPAIKNEKVVFENCVSAAASCASVVQDEQAMGDEHKSEEMEVLSSTVGALMGDGSNQPITLIPEFINGQMTYTVKLPGQQNENVILQDQQYTDLEDDDDDGEEEKSQAALSLQQPIVSAIGSVSGTSASVSATASISLSNMTTSAIINNITSSPLALPSSQSVPSNEFQGSKTRGANLLQDSQHKVSYVIVPGNNANSSSVTKLSSAESTRLTESFHSANKSQLITATSNSSVISTSQSKTTVPIVLTSTTNSATQITSANALAGIPITSSSLNITRTASGTNNHNPSVSSTLTGSGMIRVVAGGTATRTTLNTSANKLSNMFAPGKPVSTLNLSSGKKIVSFHNTIGSTNKTPTTAADAVSNAVSAALTRMPCPNFNSAKPLGSSENPIQLVQHGQTFHSVQALSQEQLRQIATVLQQQHLESAPHTKNVVYDAETNTRIIYRVVYPEDLDLREPENKAPGRGRGRRGRPPKHGGRGGSVGRGAGDVTHSRKLTASIELDLDEDRLLDDAAKGERKKQLARTRSGRLSRPPRHMVKDYKRLHHLDFADADLDDSDGGYSDYQMSEPEAEDVPEKEKNEPKKLLPGLVVPKRKISSHFRCPTCQKIYLGHSRMSRHFEMFPDHGSIEQLQTSAQNKTNSTAASENAGLAQECSPGEDHHSGSPNGMIRTAPMRRRGKRRGAWSMTPEARSERRKIKLREILGSCEAAEISEVAGPSVAGVLSLWDLLLLRVEAVGMEENLVATLCDELGALLEKVRAVMSEILLPVDTKQQLKEDHVELQDEVLCATLGVACGRYQVDDRRLRHGPPDLEPAAKRPRRDRAPECPELLSALTLVAKPVGKDTSPKKRLDEDDHQFLLVGAGEMCGGLTPPGTVGDDAESEQQTQDLQTVDDIVNERLKNLTGGNSLVDFSVSGPVNCIDDLGTLNPTVSTDVSKEPTSSDELMDTLGSFRQEDVGTGTVASFDPEIALAAMGEGDQPPVGEPSQCGRYPSPLPRIENVTGTVGSPFDSGMDLTSIVKDKQSTVVEPSIQYSSSLPLLDSSTVTSSFNSTMTLPGMGDAVRSRLHARFTSLTQSGSVEADSDPPFDTDMTLVTMEDEHKTSSSQFSSTILQTAKLSTNASFVAARETNVTSNDKHLSSFDPEIALAAMGEGDVGARRYESKTATGNSVTFDPELTLATMGEGESTRPPASQYPRQTVVINSRTFQLTGLADTGMDVSLDGSGPELDFDSLSDEFNRNTEHS